MTNLHSFLELLSSSGEERGRLVLSLPDEGLEKTSSAATRMLVSLMDAASDTGLQGRIRGLEIASRTMSGVTTIITTLSYKKFKEIVTEFINGSKGLRKKASQMAKDGLEGTLTYNSALETIKRAQGLLSAS